MAMTLDMSVHKAGDYVIEQVPLSCHNDKVQYGWSAKFRHGGKWYWLDITETYSYGLDSTYCVVNWRSGSSDTAYTDHTMAHALEYRVKGSDRWEQDQSKEVKKRSTTEIIEALIHAMLEELDSKDYRERQDRLLKQARPRSIDRGNLYTYKED